MLPRRAWHLLRATSALVALSLACGLTERDLPAERDADADADEIDAKQDTRVCISLDAPRACPSEGEVCTPGMAPEIARWHTDGSAAPVAASAIDCYGTYNDTCGYGNMTLAACFDDGSCTRVGVSTSADPYSWCGDLVEATGEIWLLTGGCSDLTTMRLPARFDDRFQERVSGTLELEFVTATGQMRHVTFEIDVSVKDFSACCLC